MSRRTVTLEFEEVETVKLPERIILDDKETTLIALRILQCVIEYYMPELNARTDVTEE